MACEQRGLFEQEITLLKKMETAASNYIVEVGFRAGAKLVAAMRLAKTNEMKLLDSQCGHSVDHEAGNATLYTFGVCTLSRDAHSCFTHGAVQLLLHHVLHYSNKFCFMAHVSITACADSVEQVHGNL